MEANVCDVNQLDADVLLPPRKRLLAGLKKRSCDVDCFSNGSFPSSSSSPSMFDARLNNLLSSHTNNPDLTPEEIAEASRSAAEAAAKAARAARAAAEEKAAIAARAVAAAKSALDLVASFSEEAAGKDDGYLRKNKLKKHVHVNSLYKKYRPVENCRTDEELARKLHRAINSSPRISKISPGSGSRSHRHKKLKISFPQDKVRVSDEDTESERERDSPMCNGHSVSTKVGPDDSQNVKPFGQSEMENGESSHSKEKLLPGDDASPNGKRRGRVKLKKLPLSICAFKEESTATSTGTRSSPLRERKTGNGSFPGGSSSDSLPPQLEAPTWKCQDLHAPACVKQNKVAQS